MKIAFSSRGPDPASAIEPHFGHARYFLIYDTASGSWTVLANGSVPPGGHGAGMAAAEKVRELGVQALVTVRMGPHPGAMLEAAGIQVKRASGVTVEEALERYLRGELDDLVVAPEDRCRHDHTRGADGANCS
ncbi:MAG: NifB/NifX family molybdenum-iron cluster-binding protein [Bryobacteraceae bacterium]